MKTLQQKDYSIALTLIFFLLGWSGLSLLLTWIGLFYGAAFILYSILFWSTYLYHHQKNRTQKKSFSKEIALISLVCFFMALAFSAFFQPSTFFSGRDQGSLSIAAIELAKNHTLTFSSPSSLAFFDLYGPGKALNFPGFTYTQEGELITQFPLTYIAWLASFCVLFGVSGILFANTTLLFLSLLVLYLTMRNFAPVRTSALFILLFVTSFPIFWFVRFTLSENIALALLWTMILGYILFYKNRTSAYYALFFISGTLLIFTRIEGYILFGIGLFSLLYIKQTRAYIFNSIIYKLILPLILSSLFISINFLINLPFYKAIAKAFISSDGDLINEPATSFFSSLLADQVYLWNIYWHYGILMTMIIGLAAMLFLLIKNKFSLPLFAPLLLTLPVLIYLIHPFISPDHPWMLRRLVFSIFPLLLFYALLLTAHLTRSPQQKKLSFLIITTIFLLQLPAFIYFFPYVNDRNLLDQTQALSEKFTPNDLILIDRLASGDAWTMLPGPMYTLFDRQAVYFFNPHDYTRINKAAFENVYLLVGEDQISNYKDVQFWKADYIDSFTLNTNRLRTEDITQTLDLPQKDTSSHNILIYRLQ